ncbi:MAG: NAD-dependent epimerase/dehydratase family protein [Alphaproteobacteria bacterium]|nr:NAD-dependent epimerase/dehydratase family protein [Alphaproteobacteria bacterium]
MTILVTGAAGFIGMHVSAALVDRGEHVVGFDNLNDYYDAGLKEARLAKLTALKGFTAYRGDIADSETIGKVIDNHPDIDRVVHLAAQAGVRYSLSHPEAYIQCNVVGHGVILEACRRIGSVKHLVYASSSSVYGGNTKLPFAVEDRVDQPVSLYAATKRAGELMSHTYSHLYAIPATGLRLFTVYGPWGRPDMSAYIFARKIFAGEPIPVFNHGKMKRDFTYVDDIAAGVVAALDHPPAAQGAVPHRLYNLGNHRSEPLLRYIELIEAAIGKKAKIDLQPMQPGDVKETYADIEASRRDFGFEPKMTIDEGIPRFVAWFRDYHGL